MTDEDAQHWLADNFNVSRETHRQLNLFATSLRQESLSQNLIAASTVNEIWSRHIVDSAQLLKQLPKDVASNSRWLDLGSGAGLPGLIVAILSNFKVTLVESRTKRIDYLQRATSLLSLTDQIIVAGMPLERLPTAQYSVISARAFAPLPRVFELAARFSTDKTVWLLPKGRNAGREWAEVQTTWTGNFRIQPSITDMESGILVGHLSGMRQKPR